MPSYASATVLAVLAFLVPLALRAIHLRLPEAAAEIVLGVVVGPQLLRRAQVDEPVRVLSTIGLGLLLLLAGRRPRAGRSSSPSRSSPGRAAPGPWARRRPVPRRQSDD